MIFQNALFIFCKKNLKYLTLKIQSKIKCVEVKK